MTLLCRVPRVTEGRMSACLMDNRTTTITNPVKHTTMTIAHDRSVCFILFNDIIVGSSVAAILFYIGPIFRELFILSYVDQVYGNASFIMIFLLRTTFIHGGQPIDDRWLFHLFFTPYRKRWQVFAPGGATYLVMPSVAGCIFTGNTILCLSLKSGFNWAFPILSVLLQCLTSFYRCRCCRHIMIIWSKFFWEFIKNKLLTEDIF